MISVLILRDLVQQCSIHCRDSKLSLRACEEEKNRLGVKSFYDDENDSDGLKKDKQRVYMLNRPSHTPLHPIPLNFAPKLSKPQWGACDSSCQSPNTAFHPPKFTRGCTFSSHKHGGWFESCHINLPRNPTPVCRSRCQCKISANCKCHFVNQRNLCLRWFNLKYDVWWY